MQFSVILVSYNASRDSLVKTLRSILKQRGVSFEVIFADDGSPDYPKNDLIALCMQYNMWNYKFSDNSENVGTVRNLLRALEIASGKYIKGIGAGDYFESEYLLRDVYTDIITSDALIASVKMSSFYRDKNGLEVDYTSSFPYNKYLYDKKPLSNLMKANQIIYQDNLSGATLFYEKERLFYYLSLIKEKVIYCEDLIQCFYTLDGYETLFIDNQEIRYEYGIGISTSKDTNSRFLNDFKEFQILLEDRYSINNKWVKNRKRRISLIQNGGIGQKVLFTLTVYPLVCVSKFFIKSLRRILNRPLT